MSPTGRDTAYIGLGGNQGDSVACLRSAVRALAALPGTRLCACSSLYRTAPVGTVAQADFVNAVCALSTGLDPRALLEHLLRIEAGHGRVRGAVPGGPRTLDLDLLLYGHLSRRFPGLELPHPRLHQRAFVLQPLAELAPELEIPGRGRVRELLDHCRGQRVQRMRARLEAADPVGHLQRVPGQE